jgi:hypothetical protein
VPFVWLQVAMTIISKPNHSTKNLQVSRLRLQNLRRSADIAGDSSRERSCLFLLLLAAASSLGLCSFGWAAT